jgi:hypothetical protein
MRRVKKISDSLAVRACDSIWPAVGASHPQQQLDPQAAPEGCRKVVCHGGRVAATDEPNAPAALASHAPSARWAGTCPVRSARRDHGLFTFH